MKKPKQCSICGTTVNLCASGNCIICSTAIATDAAQQIHLKRGPIYEKWKARLKAAIKIISRRKQHGN